MVRRFKHRSYYSNRSYFRASDFPAARTMTTEDIRSEVMPNDEKKKAKLVVYFVGERMGLVLNETNQDMLEFISGSGYPDDWIGLMIEVYCEHGVRNSKGGVIDGIRIRRASAAKQPEPLFALTGQTVDQVNAESTEEIPY